MPIPLGVLAVAGAGAGATGSFDLLETTILGVDAASVTFSNLGNYSAYKHLQIRHAVRTGRSLQIDVVRLRFNSDAGSNYAMHRIDADGSSVFAVSATSTDAVTEAGKANGNTAPASSFGGAVIDILDFSNTSKNTTTRTLSGALNGSFERIGLASGLWMNTNAVTSIELFPQSGPNFLTGSRFSLYGIK